MEHKKTIEPLNSKGSHHGYQKWYMYGKPFYIGNYKNGIPIGYSQINRYPNKGVGDKGTTINFYII